MTNEKDAITRREFVAGGVSLAATSVLAEYAQAAPKLKLAIVGTGSRGSFTWGQEVVNGYSDVVEIVGLCDHNRKRVAAAQALIGITAPTFTDFDRMIKETRPDRVIVTTPDGTHYRYIIRAMELGCDVMSEKPLCTDEQQCQAILDAQKKTGRNLTVTFNARHGLKDKKVKELMLQKSHWRGDLCRLSRISRHQSRRGLLPSLASEEREFRHAARPQSIASFRSGQLVVELDAA